MALSYETPEKCELVFKQIVHLSRESAWAQHHYDRFKQRWQIHSHIRDFFLEQGFLETHTPSRVTCPGMEPYLDSFAAGDGYLRTSPELHMKRVMAMGFDKIFQMGSCFRAGDMGRHHRPEFIMLEWYRIFADLEHLVEDLAGLLQHLAPFAKDPEFITKPFEIKTCQELFAEHTGIELTDLENREPFKEVLKIKGIPYSEEDDWDTLYFLVFLNLVEPQLGKIRPTIVTRYPASQAALARMGRAKKGEMPYCHRFELYLRGLEIANAFYELTNPEEQRERFEKEREERRALGKTVYDIDEAFMTALESGIPPSAGIALGVDRLVLAVMGLDNLEEIIPFYPE